MRRDAQAHLGGVGLAALAALLFGATTPFVARAAVGPLLTAGFLYLGAALGAGLAWLAAPRALPAGRAIARADLGTLAAMALSGAALAPALLVWGLADTSVIAASLALNGEVFFTVLLAIILYREPWRGPALPAMIAMLIGGVLLALDQRDVGPAALGGLGLVVAATLAWGIDNALSRRVSEVSPVTVVIVKGGLGASATLAVGTALGEGWPDVGRVAWLMAIGATGYGASLVCYLLAQRRLGAARTGSIFGLAPFVGAAMAVALGERDVGWLIAPGAVAFAIGVWLHAREPHGHEHAHPAETHEHAHRHDDGHHDHLHEPAVLGMHSHVHTHAATLHTHAHAPDVHHRHEH